MILVDKPNRVLERQKIYQASHKPIYLRTPRSRLYIGVFAVGFSAAMAGTTYQIYHLVKGKE